MIFDPDDLDKFGHLWKGFYDTVVEDNVWKIGSKHHKNFHIQPGQFTLVNTLKLPEGNVIKYISPT